MEKTKLYSAAHFDSFVKVCPYFNGNTSANNGYGCNHPRQDEEREDDNGQDIPACFCWSCPLGMEANDEFIDDPLVDWGNNSVEPGEVENEYLLIRTDCHANEDEKRVWNAYEKHINRYVK